MKKIVSIILAIASITLILSSCGGNNNGSTTETSATKTESVYKNDVTLDTLCNAVDSVIKSEGLTKLDGDYLVGMMGANPDIDFEAYVLKQQSTGASLDEYGIFKAKNADEVAKVEKLVDSYKQKRLDAWMNEYLVDEYPKLQNASRKTFGNYVVFTILSDTDKEAVFNAVEKTLAK